MSKAKGIRLSLGVFFSVVVLSMTGISAYLADGETIVNQTVIGGNQVEIEEDFDPPGEVEPGTVIHKDVKVRNTGHSDCYVRVLAVFSDGDMEKNCIVDWNLTDFVYNREDGYFYYPGVLKEGDCTPSLITTVTLNENINEGEIRPFSIIVYAESYQAEGFSGYQEAWEHFQRNRD